MTTAKLLEVLESVLQSLVANKTQTDEFTAFELRCDPPSEFCIIVYVYADGEPQLTCVPREVLNGSSEGTRVAFWSMTFERVDFSTEDEMHQKFLQALTVLLTRRTRIVQRRVGPMYRFIAEYVDGNKWVQLGSMAWLKTAGARLLHPDATEIMYHAEPLRRAVSAPLPPPSA